MSASNLAETAFLNLVFKNLAWAGIGDAAGLQPSAVPGNLYIRLHSADPAEAGTGETAEIAYTGYAPVAVARGAGFTVIGDTVGNAALVQFPICTAGNTVARYFSICAGPGEGAQIVASGQLSSDLAISTGIQPQFGAGALLTTVD